MSSLMDCLLKARADIAETYELDAEILDNIHQIVVNACQSVLNAKPGKAPRAEKAARVPRPKSAYNMYVHHHFQLNKEKNKDSNSQEIMSAVSKQWASLSDEEKSVYIKMADEANANTDFTAVKKSVKSAGAKRRRITGYNLFYRENKDEIKTSRSEGVSTMKAVGAAWHALTDAGRTEYNTRAAAEADETEGEAAAED
jgi:hypothetical protein